MPTAIKRNHGLHGIKIFPFKQDDPSSKTLWSHPWMILTELSFFTQQNGCNDNFLYIPFCDLRGQHPCKTYRVKPTWYDTENLRQNESLINLDKINSKYLYETFPSWKYFYGIMDTNTQCWVIILNLENYGILWKGPPQHYLYYCQLYNGYTNVLILQTIAHTSEN